MMRALPVLPLILFALLVPGPVSRGAPPAGLAGAPATGPAVSNVGTVHAAGPGARGGGGRALSAPAGNFSGASRGPGLAVPVGGGNFRGPAGTIVGPRYAPITAGARPVGTVNVPRPLGNRPATLPAVRPNLASGAAVNGSNRSPVARPYSPAAATNFTPAPSRLGAFTAAAAARNGRDRAGNGPAFRPRPDRSRQPRAYLSYPGNLGPYYGQRLPGHYVPGESYVLDPGTTPTGYAFASGPPYYLGGAFPYFYGGPVGGTFASYGGLGPDLLAPTASAPEAAAAPVASPNPAPPEAAAPAPGEEPPAAGASPTPPGPLAGPNSLVEAVQVELVRRGYFGGRTDGAFGADTGEALRRFQENHGLAHTGLINEATLFALGLN